MSVYIMVFSVPAGKVTTYKLIAEALQSRAFRGVGQALKHNPFAPLIPCHRVLASDLTIGGFRGQVQGDSIEAKREMLQQEGVYFDSKGKLFDKTVLHDFAAEIRRREAVANAVCEKRDAMKAQQIL
jgi:methylated-DNA-[protein]-cysteine S-methyltransferase